MTVIVHIVWNRKLKFNMIWSPQTEVCSAPYLHKNEFINAHHTMCIIIMDKHTPTPLLGWRMGQKLKHIYQKTSNEKLIHA
jgi:hypothetical protein